jgi:peptidoglycan/xylan/chitin deacetylase (PgdA/CDA1 family)
MGADATMSILRRASARLHSALGFDEQRLARRLRANGNRLVLVLHRVLPPEADGDFSPAGMVLAAPRFAQLLDRLGERFDLPPVESFLSRFPEPLPRPSALLTFDDGWVDGVRHAFPEMRRRAIGGVLFVSVRHVESGALFWPERLRAAARRLDPHRFRALGGASLPARRDARGWERLLTRYKEKAEEEREEILGRMERESGGPPAERRTVSWEDLRSAAAFGIEIGSHGMSHRILTRIPEEEARREIADSRRTIAERLGTAPRLFAYPNGDRSERLKEIVRDAGYAFAFSIRGTPGDRFDLSRVNLHDRKMSDRRGRWSDARLLRSLGE